MLKLKCFLAAFQLSQEKGQKRQSELNLFALTSSYMATKSEKKKINKDDSFDVDQLSLNILNSKLLVSFLFD